MRTCGVCFSTPTLFRLTSCPLAPSTLLQMTEFESVWLTILHLVHTCHFLYSCTHQSTHSHSVHIHLFIYSLCVLKQGRRRTPVLTRGSEFLTQGLSGSFRYYTTYESFRPCLRPPSCCQSAGMTDINRCSCLLCFQPCVYVCVLSV